MRIVVEFRGYTHASPYPSRRRLKQDMPCQQLMHLDQDVGYVVMSFVIKRYWYFSSMHKNKAKSTEFNVLLET